MTVAICAGNHSFTQSQVLGGGASSSFILAMVGSGPRTKLRNLGGSDEPGSRTKIAVVFVAVVVNVVVGECDGWGVWRLGSVMVGECGGWGVWWLGSVAVGMCGGWEELEVVVVAVVVVGVGVGVVVVGVVVVAGIVGVAIAVVVVVVVVAVVVIVIISQ